MGKLFATWTVFAVPTLIYLLIALLNTVDAPIDRDYVDRIRYEDDSNVRQEMKEAFEKKKQEAEKQRAQVSQRLKWWCYSAGGSLVFLFLLLIWV